MPGWHPPTYFIWPAPILAFCTSCRKIQTKDGWIAVTDSELTQLFKQNIEWERRSCPACKNIVVSPPSEPGIAPTLVLVNAS